MIKNSLGKILRVVAIVLSAMTAAINLLGGAGTSCAAFFTKDYPPYWILIKPVDYRWLYQSLVITTIAIGIVGIIVTVQLLRGTKHAYRNTLIVLGIGSILSAIQYFTSLAVIGKAAPANIKFYTNVVALIFFLVLIIPGLREKVSFSKGAKDTNKTTSGGLAAIVAGAIILSTPLWVGSSHFYLGSNWVDVLAFPMYLFGTLLTLGGIVLLAIGAWATHAQESALEKVPAI